MSAPVYGTVTHKGKSYSVHFEREGNTTSCLSGYGDFPAEEYPGIPVLRFDLADLDAVCNWLCGRTKRVDVCSSDVWGSENLLTLEGFLSLAESFGIPVERV